MKCLPPTSATSPGRSRAADPAVRPQATRKSRVPWGPLPGWETVVSPPGPLPLGLTMAYAAVASCPAGLNAPLLGSNRFWLRVAPVQCPGDGRVTCQVSRGGSPWGQLGNEVL